MLAGDGEPWLTSKGDRWMLDELISGTSRVWDAFGDDASKR
jgi:hypothetical protein